MGPLKTLCGLAAAMLILSGCGGGSGSSQPSASATGSPAGVAGSSGNSGSSSSQTPTSSGSSSPPPPASSGSSGSTSPPSTGSSGSTPPPTSKGTATLSWSAPTANSNGSALTDLAGYHIYYGTSPGSLSSEIDIGNPATLTYVVPNLGTGTWYFAVTAYTNTGLESPRSNVGSKTIG